VQPAPPLEWTTTAVTISPQLQHPCFSCRWLLWCVVNELLLLLWWFQLSLPPIVTTSGSAAPPAATQQLPHLLKTTPNTLCSSKKVGKNPHLIHCFLSFCVCFSYNYCLYDQSKCIYVIFIMIGDIWNFGFELGMIKWSWIRHQNVLVMLIIVSFGVNYENMMLDDLFESN